jgi:hypothetical protein
MAPSFEHVSFTKPAEMTAPPSTPLCPARGLAVHHGWGALPHRPDGDGDIRPALEP